MYHSYRHNKKNISLTPFYQPKSYIFYLLLTDKSIKETTVVLLREGNTWDIKQL